jgi:hypothetical protein
MRYESHDCCSRPLCGSRCTGTRSSIDHLKHQQCFGGHSERETPGHIPNPEAKTLSADGTAGATPWESRTPPDSLRGAVTPCACTRRGWGGRLPRVHHAAAGRRHQAGHARATQPFAVATPGGNIDEPRGTGPEAPICAVQARGAAPADPTELTQQEVALAGTPDGGWRGASDP